MGFVTPSAWGVAARFFKRTSGLLSGRAHSAPRTAKDLLPGSAFDNVTAVRTLDLRFSAGGFMPRRDRAAALIGQRPVHRSRGGWLQLFCHRSRRAAELGAQSLAVCNVLRADFPRRLNQALF